MKKVIVLLFALTGCALTGAHQEEAEKQAREWTVKMDMKDAKVSCVKDDSDGDGYVSCQVRHNDEIIDLECTKAFTINDGCRTPKLKVRGAQ